LNAGAKKILAWSALGIGIFAILDLSSSSGSSSSGNLFGDTLGQSLSNDGKAVGVVAAGGVGAWILLLLF
jgi:hypothetical protein